MNLSIRDEVSMLAAVLFVCVVMLLAIVIWSIRRHRDPRLHIECDSPIDQLIPSLAGLTLGTSLPELTGVYPLPVSDLPKSTNYSATLDLCWMDGRQKNRPPGKQGRGDKGDANLFLDVNS